MAWIKSYQEIARHPKTKRLAKALDISLPEAIGHLHLLWWWAMDFAKDGDLSNYEAYEIAEAMMWEGNDPKILLNALVDSGFVDQPEDGVYTIHDWADYSFGYRRLKDHEKKGRHFDLRRAYERGIIEKVRQRDGDRCFFCGIKVNWSDKRGKGGGTYALIDPEGSMNEENLVVCCRSCKRDREVQQQDDDLEPNPEQMEFNVDQVRNKSESNPDLVRNKSESNPDLVRNKSESNPDLVRNKSESNPDLVRNKSESNPDLVRNKSGSNADLVRTKSGLNQELDHGLNPDLLEEIRKEEIRINTTTIREDETDNLSKLNNYKESNEAKNPIFSSKEIIRNSSLKEEIPICDSKGINGTFYEEEDISNLEYPDRTVDKEETSKMEQELDAFLSAYCRISGKQDYQVNGEVDTALRILKQMPATVAIQYMDELYNERKTKNPDLSVNSLRYFEQGIMERWKRQNRDNTKEKGAINRGTKRQSNHPNEETDEERREREKWERINANFFARS